MSQTSHGNTETGADAPPEDTSPPAARHRTMDIAVAALVLLFGVVVMADSWRMGAGWADDGPEAGYFPFYIGLVISISSLFTLGRGVLRIRHVDSPDPNRVFVSRQQLARILALLAPLAVFVVLMATLGTYVSAVAFIAWFMARHGRHRRWAIAAVSIGVPLVLFLLFEVWFRTPLPKGPLEALLGFA